MFMHFDRDALSLWEVKGKCDLVAKQKWKSRYQIWALCSSFILFLLHIKSGGHHSSITLAFPSSTLFNFLFFLLFSFFNSSKICGTCVLNPLNCRSIVHFQFCLIWFSLMYGLLWKFPDVSSVGILFHPWLILDCISHWWVIHKARFGFFKVVTKDRP